MDIREQVETAIRNYGNLAQVPMSDDTPEEESYLATPDRLTYALGWVVANAIVGARFADSAIDALPVYHPENGWDRFLLTRRVTGKQFINETANSFGMIMLDGDDSPRITRPSGAERLSLGKTLRDDPEAAIASVLELFPAGNLLPLDLGYRWKDRQRNYPRLYQAVTEIIVEHPGVVAAREIYVDSEQVDGAFHPLYLHGATRQPDMLYDWWLVQQAGRATFFRVHAGQTIYERVPGTWSTVKRQLAQEESIDGMKARILSWLGIEGEPDPKTID
jgi:hypothetical protein